MKPIVPPAATDELVDFAPAALVGDAFPPNWYMTRVERICFMHLLRTQAPELSIEVGTAEGGSLEVLSRHSGRVVSIDVDPKVEQRLNGRFPNVEFRTGDSKSILPSLVAGINEGNESVGFVLIDGEHARAGVLADISAVLELVPRRPVCIVMHDSFNPPCREGMRSADWRKSRYVHYVDIDFVCGVHFPEAESVDDSMWGGFCVALMLPDAREGELQVLESQRNTFELVRAGFRPGGSR
jgi:hypothetical protein